MQPLLAIAFCLLGTAGAVAQTGRVMVLRAPAVAGQTAQFEMTHPTTAAGNPYLFLWSLPFAGALPVAVPGFTVQGLVRIDPLAFDTLAAGLLGAGGAVQHGVPIPSNPAYLGFGWDVQGVDLSFPAASLQLADNDVAAVVRLPQQWHPSVLVDPLVVPSLSDLAVAADGRAFAAWTNSGTGLQASTCAPGGSWGAAHNLTGQTNANCLHLAAGPDGSAMAIWCESAFAARDVVVSRYTAAAGWSAPLVIDNGAGEAADARVVIDGNGHAFAVWSQSSSPFGGTSDLIACRFVPGTGWGVPQAIENDNQGDAMLPALAVDAVGNVTVAWSRTAPNGPGYSFGVWANRLTAGSGWGTAGPIANPSANNPNPKVQVAVDGNGNAIAVWQEFDAAGLVRKVWSSRCTGTWSVPVRLDPTSVGQSFDPVVAMDPVGNAIAAWIENDGVRDNLVACRYAVGSGWGSASLVENDDTGPVLGPRLAMDYNGYGTVVWVHRNLGAFTFTVWARQFVPGAGFLAPVQVSGPSSISRNVRVGADGVGNLVTVWTEEVPIAAYDLRSAAFR